MAKHNFGAGADATQALRLVDVMSPKPSTPIPPPASPDTPILCITKLTPAQEGRVMVVTVTTYLNGQVQTSYDKHILMSSYQDMGLTAGQISQETEDTLAHEQRLYEAILQSITYLHYGSMSRRRLCQKLLAKGFDKESANQAVTYMAQKGYLDEGDTARRFAQRGIGKGWGPRRIQSDLYARGFDASVISEVMEELQETDFVTPCCRVIAQKYGAIPQDTNTRRKMTASLVRLGYPTDIIHQAIKQLTKRGT